MSNYSVIIKNGTIFDGQGDKPFKADIGVMNDEIVKIGDLQQEAAYNVIDARDEYILPGFIDITNHSDTNWSLFSSPKQESLISQGITTIIGGSCGSSLAPFLGDFSAREIRKWTDVSSINVNWRTVKEFLTEMDKHKIGVNFGTFVGLNTLRRLIVESNQKIAKIKFLLKTSLEDGSFGLSTSLGLADLTIFSDEELIDIISVLRSFRGLAKHHLEDEGKNFLPVISRLIMTARESGVSTHISHFKALGRSSWNFFEKALGMLRQSREDGVVITYDFFPYTKTGSNLLMLLPVWFRKLSQEEAMSILSSRKERRRQFLKDYLKSITLHYDKIIVASTTAATGLGKVGMTIRKLSDEANLEPEEFILDLLEVNTLRVSIFNEVISETNLDIIVQDDYSVLASDGVGYDLAKKNTRDLPHPRSFGAFPRAINQFVTRRSLIPMETMALKMSGLPAKILGINDRGILEKGKKADIVVLDPTKIEDMSTYENPFVQVKGVESVLLNGQLAMNEGKLTGSLAGKILRHG